MTKSSKTSRSNCPINRAVEILGDRWSLIVLRDMMFNNKHRFQEFLASREKIATNILTDRLSKLEGNGLITRHVDPENKKNVTYTLTRKSIELAPMMIEMVKWSVSNDEQSSQLDGLVDIQDKNTQDLSTTLKQRLLSELPNA